MAKLTQDELKRMLPERRAAYEKRRKKVERNRKILGIFVCVTLVLLTVLVLSLTVFFKINKITVLGDSIYAESQIVNAAGIYKGNNLFLCNTENAADRVCKNLPYISKAAVKRKLPSTIVIEITGAKAYIAVPTASGTALADKNGKVLELVSKEKLPSNVISLDAGTVFSAEIGANIFEENTSEKAEKKQKEKAETLRQIFKSIEASGLKNITAIDIKSTSKIYITYQNRLRMNIGSVSDIDYKLKAGAQIIKKEDEINPREKGQIFLSDTDNIYVSPDES